jgi:hypothetical protein
LKNISSTGPIGVDGYPAGAVGCLGSVASSRGLVGVATFPGRRPGLKYLHGRPRDWHLPQLGLSQPHLTLASVHCLQAFFLGSPGSFFLSGAGSFVLGSASFFSVAAGSGGALSYEVVRFRFFDKLIKIDRFTLPVSRLGRFDVMFNHDFIVCPSQLG